MDCGESGSAACIATGPCRPERRIAPQTEISSRRLGSQSFASAGTGPFRQRRGTSLALSQKGLPTRSRVAMSSANARRRLFRAPPVSRSTLS
jgi:hypothetical protein